MSVEHIVHTVVLLGADDVNKQEPIKQGKAYHIHIAMADLCFVGVGQFRCGVAQLTIDSMRAVTATKENKHVPSDCGGI